MDIFPSRSLKDSVIGYILSRPTSYIKVTAIADALHFSKGHVSEVIGSLKEEGIIKNNVADLNNPYVRSLKLAINISKIINKDLINKLKKSKIIGAGIYGSWANGTNIEESDLDLWIISKEHIKALEVAVISSMITNELKTRPEILVLDKNKLAQLRKNNEVFYFSLVFGSVILIGNGIEHIK